MINNINDDDWYLFIDESGTPGYKDKNQPFVFAISGLLVKGDNLRNKLIPVIQNFKRTCYGNQSAILHFSNMLITAKKSNNFSNLIQDFQSLFSSIKAADVFVNTVYIDKPKMKAKYRNPAHPYIFAIRILMERISYIVINNSSKISQPVLWTFFESRKKHQDKILKTNMVKEINIKFMQEHTQQKRKNFIVYKDSQIMIDRVQWHIHPLPKDPSRLKRERYFREHYDPSIGEKLIHALHLSDVIVTSKRIYYTKHFLGQIVRAINTNCNVNSYSEKYFP